MENNDSNNKTKKSGSGETFKSFVIAVLLALIFRSLLFEPFYIPSGSMKSTLLVGDYLFVKKYKYGYSRYSFPLGLPIFEDRIFKNEPKRGDVTVFRLPSNPSINYIKRLVGLPGDTIQVIGGELFINNIIVPRTKIEDFVEIDISGNKKSIPQYIETLPNGLSYKVLDENPFGRLDNTQEYTVPEGHYFMMGDNRDNSQDSRVMDQVGFIPIANLVGPAEWRFLSSSDSLLKIWNWPTSLRFDRMFTYVQIKE